MRARVINGGQGLESFKEDFMLLNTSETLESSIWHNEIIHALKGLSKIPADLTSIFLEGISFQVYPIRSS